MAVLTVCDTQRSTLLSDETMDEPSSRLHLPQRIPEMDRLLDQCIKIREFLADTRRMQSDLLTMSNSLDKLGAYQGIEQHRGNEWCQFMAELNKTTVLFATAQTSPDAPSHTARSSRTTRSSRTVSFAPAQSAPSSPIATRVRAAAAAATRKRRVFENDGDYDDDDASSSESFEPELPTRKSRRTTGAAADDDDDEEVDASESESSAESAGAESLAAAQPAAAAAAAAQTAAERRAQALDAKAITPAELAKVIKYRAGSGAKRALQWSELARKMKRSKRVLQRQLKLHYDSQQRAWTPTENQRLARLGGPAVNWNFVARMVASGNKPSSPQFALRDVLTVQRQFGSLGKATPTK